jgi:hypothetical protein
MTQQAAGAAPTPAVADGHESTAGLRHETFIIDAASPGNPSIPVYCHAIVMQQSLYCWANTQPILNELAMACNIPLTNTNTGVDATQRHAQTSVVTLLSGNHACFASAGNKSEELARRILSKFPGQLRQVYCSFDGIDSADDLLTIMNGDVENMAVEEGGKIPTRLRVERELLQRLAAILTPSPVVCR